jgi:hypothetical protein
MNHLKPMDAVAALYSSENAELSAAIIASLSKAVFDTNAIQPAGTLKRVLARVAHRVMKRTTRTETSTDEAGAKTTRFTNRLLEKSGHPYAKSLLNSSSSETATLVEGGDPMNGPYMMISPEIKKNCGVWDRLFFDSVQSRDVQLRIIWETRATYECAKRWLQKGRPVKMKAVAAGTGLSMMLVYDRLVHDGFKPEMIDALITDRDASNVAKTNRLIQNLAHTREGIASHEWQTGISASVEDLLAGDVTPGKQYDIITAIGILEYFHGTSQTTTEIRHNHPEKTDDETAHDLVERLAAMTSDDACLIVNTYKDHHSTKILELFGKKFVYRQKEHLQSLLARVHFRPAQVIGSGNIYDVKVYEKHAPAAA